MSGEAGTSLLADLKADQDPRTIRCLFCDWLRGRPRDERDVWARVARDSAGYTSASLFRQAVKRGFKASNSDVIVRHRKKNHVV